MEEKIKELAQNEEFTQKLEQTESMEDAIALFAEYGVEVTEDELKAMLADVPAGELDEAALEGVAGGSVKSWLKKIADILRRTNLPRTLSTPKSKKK